MCHSFCIRYRCIFTASYEHCTVIDSHFSIFIIVSFCHGKFSAGDNILHLLLNLLVSILTVFADFGFSYCRLTIKSIPQRSQNTFSRNSMTELPLVFAIIVSSSVTVTCVSSVKLHFEVRSRLYKKYTVTVYFVKNTVKIDIKRVFGVYCEDNS